MRTPWIHAAAVAALTLTACASGRPESGLGKATVAVTDPEIQITQLSMVPGAARYISGGLPIKYVVKVANHDKQPITLTRIDVQSIGAGAYTLNPTSRPFKMKVAPDGLMAAEFWVPAVIDDITVYGANGPVTLRCVAQFDSPVGQFQRVFVQQVHENMRETQD
ncbi:MAG: hypothetical protein JWO56_3368 [Acidobacteria bacterium]|jgi:hypothetical protein|nr:hypothetical protein [Acidobacteriota bacterium]